MLMMMRMLPSDCASRAGIAGMTIACSIEGSLKCGKNHRIGGTDKIWVQDLGHMLGLKGPWGSHLRVWCFRGITNLGWDRKIASDLIPKPK